MKSLIGVILLLLTLAFSATAADGDLDLTFNTTGFRVTDISAASNDSAADIVVQTDGKIVAIGAGNGQHAAVRYNSNGTLDTTFSGDGIATGVAGSATAGAMQPDGKILVAGIPGTSTVSLVRFNTNGTLDTTFDGDGQTIINTGATNGSFIAAVLVNGDGKILLAGYRSFTVGDLRDIVLARFNSDGSPDVTFDGDGLAIVNLTAGAIETVNDAVLQPDGKIVVVGQKNDGVGFADFLVARFNADGTPDTSFDGDGFRTEAIAPANNDIAFMVDLQTNGRIVVGGQYFDPTNQRFTAIARYNTDGSSDTSLDGDGILTDLPILIPGAMIVQADNRVILAGASGTNVYRLLKLTSAGVADTSFSLDGSVTGSGTVNAMTLQPDGKLLVTGSRVVGAGNNGFFTARYDNTSITPTAAGISISGRVITTDGRGLRNASVYLQLADGSIRTARTSSFGYFGFDEIESGQTVVVTVVSKQLAFSPRVLMLNDEITDLIISPEAGRTSGRR